MKVNRIALAAVFSTSAFALYACSSSSTSGTKTDAGADSGKQGDSGMAQDSATVIDSTVDTGNPQDTSPPPSDTAPPTDSSPPTDAPAEGGVNRGPTTLNFDPNGTGEPASIWWDDAHQILYVADDHNNEIWTWTDSAGFNVFAPVQDDPAADDAGDNQLDKLVQTTNGTLLVPRFGFAKYGAILYVTPDGGTGSVPNVPVTSRRIGLTVDSNGQVWGDSFVKMGTSLVGQVNQVDLANGETPYATGLQKPVGLLVVNGQILVSDQNQNAILAIPTGGVGDGGLLDGAPYPVYASLPVPDQLALGPNGIIYTGQFLSTVDGGAPAIREIYPDGSVDILDAATGLTQPQDVAYDPTNKRLFVADSNGTLVRSIRIYPIN
jgi:hypothetical protein